MAFRSAVLMVTALAAVTAVTGCARDSGMRVPPDDRPLPAVRHLSSQEAYGLDSIAWTPRSPVAASSQDLLVSSAAQLCGDVEGVRVTSTATDVTLALLGTVLTTCAGVPAFVTVAVRLPEPLGARQLVHAPAGPERALS